jgi:hypothetical protein
MSIYEKNFRERGSTPESGRDPLFGTPVRGPMGPGRTPLDFSTFLAFGGVHVPPANIYRSHYFPSQNFFV